MSDVRPGPLPAELRALIDADRQSPVGGDEVRSQVRARVLTTVGSIPAGGDGGAEGGGAAAPGSGLGTGAGLGVGSKLVVVSLIGGALAGGTWYAARSQGSANVDPPARSLPATAATTTRPAVEPPPAAIEETPATPPDRAGRTRPRPKGAPRRMAPREEAILEQAWAALAGGDPALALRLAHQHARTYPAGALAEERDVLLIRCAIAMGDRSLARELAGRFAVRYPASIHLPAIRAGFQTPSETP